MKRLVVIDGKSVFYRGYYAMPQLSMSDGTPTGGVYGFTALSLEIIKQLQPDYVAVAWDKPKTNIRKRQALYAAYKANRKPAPPDFYEQIPLLHELLDAFGWPLYELDDYEADDIMGTFARQAEAKGVETCLITSDLDALQLVGPLTHVYAMKQGFTHIELFKPESFEAKYGIRVDQFLDLKALKGDSSDNLPGVSGIGEKTAIALLQRYDTLDGIYDNVWEIKDSVRRKLEAGRASAYLSKAVAEIWCDAPVQLDWDIADVNDIDTLTLKKMLTKLEFRSLLRALPAHMRSSEPLDTPELATIEPATQLLPDDDFYARCQATTCCVVWRTDEGMYVSPEPTCAAVLPIDRLLPLMDGRTVIAHDARAVYLDIVRHTEKALSMDFSTFDTKHAAFLLDPLRKSRELGDLTGVSVTNPLSAVAAVWALYHEHMVAFEHVPKLKKVAYEIDFPLIPVLVRMEYRGILLDTTVLHAINEQVAQRIADVEQTMYELVGHEFNSASPAQLSEVLFTTLKLPTVGIKKGRTGYSTSQSELSKLRGVHPIIAHIETHRELSKLQNTYLATLPQLVDRSSRLHTTFNQDVVATGRLSSTDPNLQNIPVRSALGRSIRRAFVPAAGNVFVSADYSQFELRLAAVLAGDEQMIADFNSDIDIHTKTAADVYGIPLDQVTKDQRRDAKVINFGVLYGMSPHGLATATGMTFEAAKQFIDDFFRLRAPIRRYIDATITKARRDGYVETYFGRRRPTPDVTSSNYMVRSSAERQAVNMPIQGTEADLMKMAMLRVERAIDGIGVQVLQIHDSILVECPADNADRVTDILRTTMETIYPDFAVKLQVATSVGHNWGDV